MKPRSSLLIAFIALTNSNAALAQWVNHGAPVCTAIANQFGNQIISDGAGGAFITWYDGRSGGTYDVYAQRINALGQPLWALDGVAVCTAPNHQGGPQLVSDGAGGVIIVWDDFRPGPTLDIYAQRLNGSGTAQWTANGVALCTAVDDQSYPTITNDGAGGAIVTWMDERTGGLRDIFCRRINSSGTPLWTANGVALCTATGSQQSPTIVSDGVGGAIVTWWDPRAGSYDIYCQRVNGSGTVQWTANGVALCTAVNDQANPMIVSDNANGAIVAWSDLRSGAGYDVYSQRISSGGIVQWTSNGVAACDASGTQNGVALVADGIGGAIIAWNDDRSTNYDIYVQRITSTGAPQWTENGVAVCTAANGQSGPTIVSDGLQGAIVAWQDSRTGPSDIYAQRVDASGFAQWSSNGVSVCAAAGNQQSSAIAPDGGNGALIAWYDYRAGLSDIYAQRVEATFGYWGRPEPTVISVADIPNDQGGHVAINWKASGRDDTVPRTISYYTIWRAVDPVAATSLASATTSLTKLSDVSADAIPPIYISTPSTAPPPYYWELVGTQLAHGWPGYSFSAPTRADNTPQFFMVAAHIEFDDYVAFTSNAMSGQSVDNPAPS
jgi:hypothetical protein